LLAKGTKKGQSAAQETPMEPTPRAAWREAGISALTISVVFILMIPLTRGNFLLAQTVAIATMGFLLVWRRGRDWWRALAAGASAHSSAR
jgi:hypothetical protein